MKKAIIIGLLMAVSSVYAGGATNFHGGASIPTGAGSKNWDVGFLGGIKGLGRVNSFLLFGVGAQYNRWTANDEETVNTYGTETGQPVFGLNSEAEGHRSMIQLMALIRINPVTKQKLGFFLDLGAGMFVSGGEVSITIEEELKSQTTYKSSDIGFHAAGGFDFKLNKRASFLIGPAYTHVLNDNSEISYVDLEAGIMLDF